DDHYRGVWIVVRPRGHRILPVFADIIGCPRPRTWRNGRRKGLKIPWGKPCAGSSPAVRTGDLAGISWVLPTAKKPFGSVFGSRLEISLICAAAGYANTRPPLEANRQRGRPAPMIFISEIRRIPSPPPGHSQTLWQMSNRSGARCGNVP